jgi:putative addiction module killer protein
MRFRESQTRDTSASASPAFEELLSAHVTLSAKPRTTEPGDASIQAHARIHKALADRDPHSTEQILASQASLLVDIRLHHPISIAQIVSAIELGATVEEIEQSARSVSSDDTSGIQNSNHESSRPVSDAYPFKEYVKDGKPRFSAWLDQLDPTLRNSVEAKLARVTADSVKKLKPLRGGANLFEIRVYDGPGLRMYVGLVNDQYALLHGGRKDTQFFDVLTAFRLLSEVRSGVSGTQLCDLSSQHP